MCTTDQSYDQWRVVIDDTTDVWLFFFRAIFTERSATLMGTAMEIILRHRIFPFQLSNLIKDQMTVPIKYSRWQLNRTQKNDSVCQKALPRWVIDKQLKKTAAEWLIQHILDDPLISYPIRLHEQTLVFHPKRTCIVPSMFFQSTTLITQAFFVRSHQVRATSSESSFLFVLSRYLFVWPTLFVRLKALILSSSNSHRSYTTDQYSPRLIDRWNYSRLGLTVRVSLNYDRWSNHVLFWSDYCRFLISSCWSTKGVLRSNECRLFHTPRITRS